MSAENNGGPAFPSNYTHTGGRQFNEEGMELRDYFAAAALQGMWAHYGYDVGQQDTERAARLVYGMADAMLAERLK